MITEGESRWAKAWKALHGEIFASSTIAENSRALLERIGGRLTGSPSGRDARDFAKEILESIPVDVVVLEPFPVQGWERGPLTLEMTAPISKKIDAFALGLSRGTPSGGLEGPVADMGFGLPGDMENHRDGVKGRWVLAEDRAPEGEEAPHRAVKMAAAAEAGALGFLLMSREPGRLPKTGTCTFTGLSRIPGAGISREDGLRIRRALASGLTVTLRMAMENRAYDAEGTNVIGLLKGRERPEETVYVGAHLDAWDIADGALDNGSGVLVALEAARALAKLPERPRRTVVFCLFMGEETGLCGSTRHVASMGDALDRLVAYLNLDIVSAPLQLVAGGPPARFPLLEEVTRALGPLGVQGEIDLQLGLHSDHVPFLLEGIPTLSWRCGFKEDTLRYCHSAADTWEKNDLRGLHLCAAGTSALLHALADHPARPVERIRRSEVKRMLEDAGLRKALEAEGAWPF